MLDLSEPVHVGPENVSLQDKVGELAFTDNLDQAGRFQLLYMMGDSCRAYRVRFVQLGAGCRPSAGSDLFQDLIPPRLGQGAGNPCKLPVGQSFDFTGCHLFFHEFVL